MPKRARRRPVTRVSSQRTRSTPRKTHRPRSVMSPRLPIGVATRCRPGASAWVGDQTERSTFRAGLLAPGARSGSAASTAPSPEAGFAAVAACQRGPTVPAPVVSGQSEGPRGAPLAPVTGGPLASTAGQVKVALLLPLSGPNADLGKAMLDAAQLALFTMGGESLTLVPRDTGGTPEGAAKAARSAVDEKVGLILGPLLAGEVQAVKPIAAGANINVIAFSTATQLAGGNIFLMGFLPHDEAVREVAFAR